MNEIHIHIIVCKYKRRSLNRVVEKERTFTNTKLWLFCFYSSESNVFDLYLEIACRVWWKNVHIVANTVSLQPLTTCTFPLFSISRWCFSREIDSFIWASFPSHLAPLVSSHINHRIKNIIFTLRQCLFIKLKRTTSFLNGNQNKTKSGLLFVRN